jgi:hypothetical protein
MLVKLCLRSSTLHRMPAKHSMIDVADSMVPRPRRILPQHQNRSELLSSLYLRLNKRHFGGAKRATCEYPDRVHLYDRECSEALAI